MLQRRELDYCPPAPDPPPVRLGFVELLIRLKRNPLECWSADFFQEPIAKLRLPFADAFLVHDPKAIKRVLMDNAKNYRKDAIQRRILAAGLSDGLLSVEGERWELQRRILAPIFARRTVNFCFASCDLVCGGEIVLVASGVFKVPDIDKIPEAARATVKGRWGEP